MQTDNDDFDLFLATLRLGVSDAEKRQKGSSGLALGSPPSEGPARAAAHPPEKDPTPPCRVVGPEAEPGTGCRVNKGRGRR